MMVVQGSLIFGRTPEAGLLLGDLEGLTERYAG
jgi:hypothetical protein